MGKIARYPNSTFFIGYKGFRTSCYSNILNNLILKIFIFCSRSILVRRNFYFRYSIISVVCYIDITIRIFTASNRLFTNLYFLEESIFSFSDILLVMIKISIISVCNKQTYFVLRYSNRRITRLTSKRIFLPVSCNSFYRIFFFGSSIFRIYNTYFFFKIKNFRGYIIGNFQYFSLICINYE